MVIKSYKGMDKNMQCRGFQYEAGKKYEQETAELCGKGFHACESPMDVLRYYRINEGSRFFEVEQSGKITRNTKGDSKVSSSILTVGAEIGLPGIIKAHVDYTRKKAEEGENGGNHSNLAGGDYSNLAGGDYSNLAGGNGSNLAGGDGSLIVGGDKCRTKGGLHSVICLTEWDYVDGEHVPVAAKAVIVDGKTIKPGTWYTMKNGEIVEA